MPASLSATLSILRSCMRHGRQRRNFATEALSEGSVGLSGRGSEPNPGCSLVLNELLPLQFRIVIQLAEYYKKKKPHILIYNDFKKKTLHVRLHVLAVLILVSIEMQTQARPRALEIFYRLVGNLIEAQYEHTQRRTAALQVL